VEKGRFWPPEPSGVKGNRAGAAAAPALALGRHPAWNRPMLVGWTTLPSRDQAERLAAAAVAGGLAACAQVEGPVASHYRWEGRLERAEEFRLCLKFLPRQLEALEAFLLHEHPYSTPEWIVVRAERVAEKYLSWAEASSTKSNL
jgi:periplasmic divalent cation tolerance protein